MKTVDGLGLRRVMGRTRWGVPRVFGPDGWVLDELGGTGRIIVTASENPPDMRIFVHASMSFADRVPTYEELCQLHRAVWGSGYAYQVFVGGPQHVNIHPYALHLWGLPDGSPVLPEFGMEIGGKFSI